MNESRDHRVSGMWIVLAASALTACSSPTESTADVSGVWSGSPGGGLTWTLDLLQDDDILAGVLHQSEGPELVGWWDVAGVVEGRRVNIVGQSLFTIIGEVAGDRFSATVETFSLGQSQEWEVTFHRQSD